MRCSDRFGFAEFPSLGAAANLGLVTFVYNPPKKGTVYSPARLSTSASETLVLDPGSPARKQ